MSLPLLALRNDLDVEDTGGLTSAGEALPSTAKDEVLSNSTLLLEILSATSKDSPKPFAEVCNMVNRLCASAKCSEDFFQTVGEWMEIPIPKPDNRTWTWWTKKWCRIAQNPQTLGDLFSKFPTREDPLASLEWIYKGNIFPDTSEGRQLQTTIVLEAARRRQMDVVEYMLVRVRDFTDVGTWESAINEAATFMLQTESFSDEDFNSLQRLLAIRDETANGQDPSISVMSSVGLLVARRFHLEVLQWWHREKAARSYFSGKVVLMTAMIIHLVKDPNAETLKWLSANEPNIADNTWHMAWEFAFRVRNETVIAYLLEHQLDAILRVRDRNLAWWKGGFGKLDSFEYLSSFVSPDLRKRLTDAGLMWWLEE